MRAKNILDWLMLIILFYPVALMGAQWVTRYLKVTQTPKKIWKFELPTKKEYIFALITTIAVVFFMILNPQ